MSEHDDDLPADGLLDRLGAELAPLDVDDVRAERIRRLAHRELAAGAAGRRGRGGVLRSAWLAYRAIEPALVVGFGAIYLGWAVLAVITVYR
jgi:hypothetical protein